MGKCIDETGRRYGRWAVMERRGSDQHGKAMWYCQCDCGAFGYVEGGNLRSGDSRSCGCFGKEQARKSHFMDRIGQQFGRLTVVKLAGVDRRNKTVWLCHCECGVDKKIPNRALVSGDVKSCGCLWREDWVLRKGQASFNALLGSYKRGALKRGHEWRLTSAQSKELFQQDCYYCGRKPQQQSRQKGCNGVFVYNGLDRLDNGLGYTLENVVPCCKLCNLAKRTSTVGEFKAWIKQVYEYSGLGAL